MLLQFLFHSCLRWRCDGDIQWTLDCYDSVICMREIEQRLTVTDMLPNVFQQISNILRNTHQLSVIMSIHFLHDRPMSLPFSHTCHDIIFLFFNSTEKQKICKAQILRLKKEYKVVVFFPVLAWKCRHLFEVANVLWELKKPSGFFFFFCLNHNSARMALTERPWVKWNETNFWASAKLTRRERENF